MSTFGLGFDRTFKIDPNLKTTTTQYLAVGAIATTTLGDNYVQLCGQAGTAGTGGSPTASSNHAMGINQNYLTSDSDVACIRLFGLTKAIAAESIPAGAFVRAYQGISTTTMAGRIVRLTDRVTASAATMSLCSHTVILGRALEDFSTGTVGEIFLNPQLYDNNLVASTT